MLAAILVFSARHHLCQFMPAVSETTDNREHFDIWHILLYGGVRVTPRKSGQFHSLSPYHDGWKQYFYKAIAETYAVYNVVLP